MRSQRLSGHLRDGLGSSLESAPMPPAIETSLNEAAEFGAVDASLEPSRRCCEILEILNEILDDEFEREDERAAGGV